MPNINTLGFKLILLNVWKYLHCSLFYCTSVMAQRLVWSWHWSQQIKTKMISITLKTSRHGKREREKKLYNRGFKQTKKYHKKPNNQTQTKFVWYVKNKSKKYC